MLEMTVFLCGALVMILEMVGARVLAPHVGTSAIVWTSLIGVVLACLAAGAWAGGRFADKKLSAAGLGQTLAGAAAGCAITAFCHTAIGAEITRHVGNLYAAAVIAAIAIFAIPAFFFGMITPYVIRLRIASIDTAGATVGRLYALSTAGSILGTFLGGFVLVSFFSSTAILWGLACAMLLLSLLNSFHHPWMRFGILAVFIFLAWQDLAYADWLVANGGTRLVESPYNSIRIMEAKDYSRDGTPVRLLATDPGYTQSGMMLNSPNELYFDYTRFYALGPKYVPEARNILMLGGGGYSVPKWLLSGKSGLPRDLRLKVVELDPAMTKTAKEYFSLPEDGRMTISHEDARAFLNRQKEKFDLVFVDVFNSHYAVPFQMATAEAAKAMRNAVADGGALLVNVISAVEGEDGRLFRAIWQNLANEFEAVKVYCVGRPTQPDKVQNLIIVAFPQDATARRGETATFSHPGMSPSAVEVAEMEKHIYRQKIDRDVPPLVDDFAPVERYTLMLTKP